MSSFGSLGDPPATFVLTGARVIDPSTEADSVRDLNGGEGMRGC